MSEKILIRDIPVVVTLGNLCKNVSLAHKIMVAIIEKREMDAFDIAKEILNNNDALIEANIDKEALTELINDVERKNQKYN